MKSVRFICTTCVLDYLEDEELARRYVKNHLNLGHNAYIAF